MTGDDWAAFAGPISDHQRLPAERLRTLQAAIHAAIACIGEPICVRGTTFASFARRGRV